MTDYLPNNKKEIPERVADFGSILRDLRQNHGYSLQTLSKMIHLPVSRLSRIECASAELPPENILRKWLEKLGCGKNTQKLIVLSRQWRVHHTFQLKRKESCNPDILRLMDAYQSDKLTDYDRDLLKLIARTE